MCDKLLPGFEIAITGEENKSFKLLHEDSLLDEELQVQFKNAKENWKAMRLTIIQGLQVSKKCQEHFKEHEEQLEQLMSEHSADEKENSKKKRRCMRGLKVFTAGIKKPSSTPTRRKSTDGKDRGWSKKANIFMFNVTSAIQEDVAGGKHKHWENTHKEIIKTTVKAGAANKDQDEDEHKIDCNVVCDL